MNFLVFFPRLVGEMGGCSKGTKNDHKFENRESAHCIENFNELSSLLENLSVVIFTFETHIYRLEQEGRGALQSLGICSVRLSPASGRTGTCLP